MLAPQSRFTPHRSREARRARGKDAGKVRTGRSLSRWRVEGILPSNSSYRIFMQHHRMQGLGLGT